jgi:hypothetical protein
MMTETYNFSTPAITNHNNPISLEQQKLVQQQLNMMQIQMQNLFVM